MEQDIGTRLRDESLTRIAILANAMKENIDGSVVMESIYPDTNPNTVLRDLAVANSLVRILTATYTIFVKAIFDEANPDRKSEDEDHVGGGSTGG